MSSIIDKELMSDPAYRKEAHLVCKQLGEKYGNMLNSLLAEIKQEKNNANINRTVPQMVGRTQRID
jgi:hypothetical protein